MKLPWVNNVFHSYSLTQNTNLFLHFLPRDRSQTSGRSTIVECTALCRRTENKTNWQPLKELGHDNDLEVAHPQSGSLSTWFLVELEFENVGFWGERKTGVPGEKPLGAKERTNNKLNPHMASTPGFEPGPHWWEASALTTAPSLAPRATGRNIFCSYMFLRVIGSCRTKFETSQTFAPATPNISFVLWSPKRSATMLDPFASLFQYCWGHTRALHIIPKVK